MFNLPDDIKEYIKKGVLKRVIPCIIMIILSLFLVYFTYDYLAGFGKYNPLALLILCIVISLVKTGIPDQLVDRSFSGTVLKIIVKKISWLNHGIRYTGGKYTRAILYIQDKKNRIHDFTVNNSKLDEHGYDEIYNKGDRVFHVYGTKYLGVFPLREDYSVCVICGAKNHHTSGKCDICKHTLITKKHINP